MPPATAVSSAEPITICELGADVDLSVVLLLDCCDEPVDEFREPSDEACDDAFEFALDAAELSLDFDDAFIGIEFDCEEFAELPDEFAEFPDEFAEFPEEFPELPDEFPVISGARTHPANSTSPTQNVRFIARNYRAMRLTSVRPS